MNINESGQLSALQRSIDRLSDKLDEHVKQSHVERREMDTKIEGVKTSIVDITGKLKGGWFVILLVGALVSAAVTWFLTFRSH